MGNLSLLDVQKISCLIVGNLICVLTALKKVIDENVCHMPIYIIYVCVIRSGWLWFHKKINKKSVQEGKKIPYKIKAKIQQTKLINSFS